MGLFDRVNKIWSGADFWDKKENAQQRQQFNQQDEERKRREAAARAQAKANAQAQAQQRQQQQTNSQSSSNFDLPFKPEANKDPFAPSTPKPEAPKQVYKPVTPEAAPVDRNQKVAKLNELRDKNLAKAMQEEKGRTSFLGRAFTDRNWDKRARATAIQRATREYQDKYGWNKDEDVVNYLGGAKANIEQSTENKASKWVAPVLSTARVGTGIVQGAAGLYDLATPGKGTNRISQAADKKAQEQDQLAKDLGVDGAYKVGNVAGEIASYAIPGMIAAKAAKGLNAGAKLGKAGTALTGKVDDIARLIDNGGDANKIRQFIAARVKQNFTVEEALQELMITGRYMGQNTAQGGDTSVQSVGTDALMGLAGGLLVPAKGFKQLFNNIDGTAVASDDAAGAAVAGASRQLDNALTPPVPEVAPGVKAPNIVNGKPEIQVPNPTQVVPTPNQVVPNPAQVPTTNPVQPPVVEPTPVPQQPVAVPPTSPTPQPTQGAVPTGVVHQVPQRPQTIDNSIQKPLVETPPVQQVVPETAPVSNPIETPIIAESRQVAEQSAPVNVEEAVKAATPPPSAADAELTGRRESYIAEREQLIADGMSTKSVDARIKALDKQIAAKSAKPTEESKVLAEGDKQLAEATAKPEVKQTEKPKKPAKAEATTTVEPTAKGNEAPAKAPKNSPAVQKTLDGLTAQQNQHQKGSEIWNRFEKIKQDVLDKAAEDASTKAPKAVKSKPAKVEAPSKPAPTREELQKGAAENTNKNGKVSKPWIKSQVKAGADEKDIVAAVEKVQGKTVPKVKKEIPTKPVNSGGLPLNSKQGVGSGADTAGKIYDATDKAVNVKQGKQIIAEQGHRETFNKLAERLSNLKDNADGDATALTAPERNAAEELRKTFEQGTTEHNMLSEIIGRVNQDAAQVLATANRLMRETATDDEIVNHFVDRAMKKMNGKFNEEDMTDLKSLTTRFVKSRVEYNKSQDAFKADPTSKEAADASKAAFDAKMQASKDQKLAELRLLTSKNTDKASKKEMYKLIDKLGKEADVWQMDLIDTSLLSTTGTWTANFLNSTAGSLEETLFGRVGARFATWKTGATVGGGNAYRLKALGFGANRLKREASNRTQLPHKWVGGQGLNGLKNFVTTMNEIGNVFIDSGGYSGVRDEYGQLLKNEYPDKFGGKMTSEAKAEFKNLLDVYAHTDPRDLRQKYINYGYNTQGMASMRGHAGKNAVAKLENRLASGLSSGIQFAKMPKNISDNIAKLTMRVVLGYPTIVVRSAEQGLRRTGLGVPTFVQARLTKDPVEKAMLIKQGIKEMGSGAALLSAGWAAGQSGAITGAYPTDKTTQEEWAKEGKSEWSIKIGKDYYGLPRMLGPFAIPFLVGAQMGDKENSDGGIWNFDNLRGVADSVLKSYDAAMPTDQISDNLKTITDLKGIFSDDENERKKAEQAFVKFGGNAARIGAIPLSGLVNEIAQMTNPNQQDSKQYDNVFEGIINHIYAGMPVLNDKMLPDKTAKDGTVLKNTNPLARAFGASSSENTAGVEDNKKKVEENQNDLSPVVNDKNIFDLLEPETQELLRKTQDPKQKKPLNDQNFETIYKDVSKTTEKLASEGKWESYGNTLKVKLSTQKADKKSTPVEQAETSRKITQADIMNKAKIDPRVFQLYVGKDAGQGGGVSQGEFADMMDPEEDAYDPDTAALLWELDELFTKGGVSANTKGIDPWTKQKYKEPKKGWDGKGGKSGSGSGSDKVKASETDFGTIGSYAKPPSGNLSQKYQKLTESGSPMPNLTTSSARTNLKKNISVVKGVRL